MSEEQDARWAARDEAVARLEDHLLTTPYDRALPFLAELLAQADVDPDLVRRDERARKLVREAILARPLSDLDDVAARSAEVELLVLEVAVLTEDLRAGEEESADASTRERADAAAARVDAIRARLAELRRGL